MNRARPARRPRRRGAAGRCRPAARRRSARRSAGSCLLHPGLSLGAQRPRHGVARALAVWDVNLLPHHLGEAAMTDVAHHAHDLRPGGNEPLVGHEIHLQPLADRVPSRPGLLREPLVHDHHRGPCAVVRLREAAARDQLRADRLNQPGLTERASASRPPRPSGPHRRRCRVWTSWADRRREGR